MAGFFFEWLPQGAISRNFLSHRPVFLNRLNADQVMNHPTSFRALSKLAAGLMVALLFCNSPLLSAQQGSAPRLGGINRPNPAASRQALRGATASTYGVGHNPLRNSNRAGIIGELGGSQNTETAVLKALNWFTRTQKEDGHWAETQSNVAHTGLAILCYLSYGIKPDGETPNARALAKGLAWLVKQVPEDGNMRDGGRMYGQAIGTLALGEAAGITHREDYYQPLERAVNFLCKAQNPKSGGWRYQPYPALKDAGDLSVTGWVIMALRSAEMAGVQVPQDTLKSARTYLDLVAAGTHKGLYGYKQATPKLSMTSVGMYCQQLFGAKPVEVRQIDSAKYLALHLPAESQKDYYYWYYGCLSMFLHGGDGGDGAVYWEKWNKKMVPLFLKKQQTNGSWKAEGRRAKREGTTVTTAWATLSLTVYYRYLPITHGYTRLNTGPQSQSLIPNPNNR